MIAYGCCFVLDIKCTVEKFGLWFVRSANSACIWPTFLMLLLILNFPHRYANHSMALLYFSWTTTFFSNPDRLFWNSAEFSCCRQLLNFFFLLPLSLGCWLLNDIFAEFTQFNCVNVYYTHMPRFLIPMALVKSSWSWVRTMPTVK